MTSACSEIKTPFASRPRQSGELQLTGSKSFGGLISTKHPGPATFLELPRNPSASQRGVRLVFP